MRELSMQLWRYDFQPIIAHIFIILFYKQSLVHLTWYTFHACFLNNESQGRALRACVYVYISFYLSLRACVYVYL